MNPHRPAVKVMAANLTQTAKNVIKGALAGDPTLASEETSNSRLEICNKCEFFVKDQIRCNKCGCFMNAKVKFQSATCPIQKW